MLLFFFTVKKHVLPTDPKSLSPTSMATEVLSQLMIYKKLGTILVDL